MPIVFGLLTLQHRADGVPVTSYPRFRNADYHNQPYEMRVCDAAVMGSYCNHAGCS